VIEKNERIYPKSLEVGYTGESHPPRLLVYEELFEQYQAISTMIQHSGSSYDQIAVIFRNNASADGIEGSLRELGIPCRRKGGNSFFDAKEVKFLLDLLTLLVNPKDMMAFIHLFEYAKGVGSALAKDLFHCLIHFGEGDLIRGVLRPTVFDLPRLNPRKNLQLGLFEDDLEIGAVSRFSGVELEEELRAHPLLKHPRLSHDGLLFFREYYLFLRSVRQSRNPGTILRKAIDSNLYTGLVERLSTQRAQLKSGEVDPEKKLQARERIMRKARLLQDLGRPYRELLRFVNAMVLGGNELSEGEGVNLLTVHASKGLEFGEVYVVDLMDGRFPNRKLMSMGGSLEEERRLFYVAVTRAKEKLYLSMAKTDRIKKLDFIPSPFLYEAGLIKGRFPEK
jgi:DNA helicase-2/ATP-dependent DNA helicase PcrA